MVLGRGGKALKLLGELPKGAPNEYTSRSPSGSKALLREIVVSFWHTMATAVSENTGERFGISGGAMLTYSVRGKLSELLRLAMPALRADTENTA